MKRAMGERAMMWRGAASALVLVIALAGCSRSSETPEPEETGNSVVEVAPPAPEAPPPPEVEAPAPKEPEPDRNVAEALPPEEAPSVDEQMLEDADAAGLTSRSAPRDAETGSESNDGSRPDAL